MRKVLTSLFLLVTFLGLSQTTTTTTTRTSTSASSSTSKYVATWNLTQTEVFNEVHKPTDTQAHDQLIIMADGKYRLIYNGVAEGGTWVADASYITLTSLTGITKKFKVMEATSTTLKIDYKDETDIHNILYYSTPVTSAK